MNNAAISIFRYRKVADTIERKLMLFTTIWETTCLVRWYSTHHLSGKGEFVFSKLK